MTKKDYILIGNSLKNIFNEENEVHLDSEQKEAIITAISIAFHKENNRFDFDKFYAFVMKDSR